MDSKESPWNSVHAEIWPAYDPALLIDDEIVVAVQVNGKTRGEIRVAHDTDKVALESAARESVATRLEGKTVVRTIVVPGRIVNFVVQD